MFGTSLSYSEILSLAALNPSGQGAVGTGDWKILSANDLGLPGGSTTFFPFSGNGTVGLNVYQNKTDPNHIALTYSAVSFDDLPDVFETAAPTPPFATTAYADDFASVYAAILDTFPDADTISATGFSLGGTAVNQLADSFEAHFGDLKGEFVAFGGEYLSSDSRVLNFGAENDWLFGSYNEYNAVYDPNDPGLSSYDTFSDLFFVPDEGVDALPSDSALRRMFDLKFHGDTDKVFDWYFDYGSIDSSISFNSFDYFEGHGVDDLNDALQRVVSSKFGEMIDADSHVIVSFTDDATEVGDTTNPFLTYSFSDTVFIFGKETADTVIGHGGIDLMDGLAGFDTLIGGDGADVLDGGSNPEGASGQGDILLGGAGDDTYHVDSPLDLVDEGFVFPDAGWGGTDTVISTANWYWDSQSVGEIDRIAEDAADPGGAGVTFVGGIFDNALYGHSGTDILFGRGGNDVYVPGDGIDWISLSTLGLTDDNAYAGVDGHNTVIVTPRTSGGFSYDILFDFDPAKDKVDVSAYGDRYASGADVLSHAADDGAGSSFIALGDGLDYLYFVGLTKAELNAGDFVV